jgi:hypothetical protein
MADISRRSVVVGTTIAPLVAAAPRLPSSAPTAHSSPKQCDPVTIRVRQWAKAKDAQDELVRQWQEAEDQLCPKIRPLQISLTAAVRGRLPEAKLMRALMRKIKAADRKLDRAAARIVTMRATTPAGALAKIEMGLKIQEPLDCEEYSWALLQCGFEELRSLL